jgi:RNA polymerase primary sigma factor
MAKSNEAVSQQVSLEETHHHVTAVSDSVARGPKDFKEAEPTEAELAEAAADLASLKTDDAAVGSLARYFRDMSSHPVMNPTEEATAAEEFLNAEIQRWHAVLSYAQAFPMVRRVIEGCLAELPEPVTVSGFDKVEKVLKDFLKNRSKFDRKLQSKWDEVTQELAVTLRALDADRLFIEAIDEELARAAGDVANAEDLFEENAPDDPGTVLSVGFKRYLVAVADARDTVFSMKNRFVAANLRLVVSIARRYNRGRMPLIDIIQEGNMGLIKAVERFDHTRGYRFSTYASWWIRHAISRGLADKGRAVRIPVHMLDTYNRVQRTAQTLQARTGREPTMEELAAETGITLEKLDRMQRDWAETPFSLDRPVGEEDGKRLVDCLQDDKTLSPYEQVESSAWTGEVKRLLDILSPLEARIIRWRFGLDDEDELTLKEIGDKYNLSRERIRQLQEQALAKIRKQVRE